MDGKERLCDISPFRHIREKTSVRLIGYAGDFIIITNWKMGGTICWGNARVPGGTWPLAGKTPQHSIFPCKNRERLHFFYWLHISQHREGSLSYIANHHPKAGKRFTHRVTSILILTDGIMLLKRRIKSAFSDNIFISLPDDWIDKPKPSWLGQLLRDRQLSSYLQSAGSLDLAQKLLIFTLQIPPNLAHTGSQN